MITLYEEYQDAIHVNLERSGTVMIIPKNQLVEGAVFGLRHPGPLVLRMWVKNGKIMVLHVFSKDVQWPQDVYEFPLEFTPVINPMTVTKVSHWTKVTPLHEYLAAGNGIPELPPGK